MMFSHKLIYILIKYWWKSSPQFLKRDFLYAFLSFFSLLLCKATQHPFQIKSVQASNSKKLRDCTNIRLFLCWKKKLTKRKVKAFSMWNRYLLCCLVHECYVKVHKYRWCYYDDWWCSSKVFYVIIIFFSHDESGYCCWDRYAIGFCQ